MPDVLAELQRDFEASRTELVAQATRLDSQVAAIDRLIAAQDAPVTVKGGRREGSTMAASRVPPRQVYNSGGTAAGVFLLG